MLATSSQDTTIILWDIANSELPGKIATLNGHQESVRDLAYSADGNYLFSGSWDDKIIIWDLNPQSLFDKACNIIGRNLTLSEWKIYFGDEPYQITCPQWPVDEDAAAAMDN